MKTDIANVKRSSAPKKPIVSFPCCHTRGGHRDRGESALGSWVWRGFASRRSRGTESGRALGFGSLSNDEASVVMSVLAVGDGRGGGGDGRAGPGTTCRGPRTA